MKKKLASILMAIVCVFAIGFCALACGSESEINGTYYMYINGQLNSTMEYVFEDGDFTAKYNGTVQSSGTYKVDGDKITMTSGGKSVEITKVSDGVIKLEDGMYLCMEGKTPPTDEAEE